MPIGSFKDKNSYLQERLEKALSKRAQISSPLSIFLLLIFTIMISQLSDLSPIYWISGSVLLIGLAARTWWSLISSTRWHLIFILLNVVVSIGWSGLLLAVLMSKVNFVAISTLTYAIIAALVASAPHTLALSKYSFFAFSTFITFPLLYGVYVVNQGTFYLISGTTLVFLFVFFLANQRSQLEKAWRELELFNYELQVLLNTLPVGVAVVREGILIRGNSFFDSIMSLSKNEAFSQTALNKLFEHSLSEANDKILEEILLPVDENNKQPHLSMTQNIEGINGRETIITLVNVNDIRSLEIENQKQKIQIENSSKMAALGVMSSGLAHEINNPLATISGRVQLMQMVLRQVADQMKSTQFDKLEKSIEVIQKTILRISKIIKGLRSFARESDGDPFESIKLNDVVETTLSFCESRFSSRGIDVQIQVEKDLVFHGRSTEISQVLLNALNNSFDAIETRTDKWIKLMVEKKSEKIVIKIQDSGPGIPQQLREKIMIPFFTTKEVGNGTGLGLSVSRGILESHGGRLYFNHSSPFTELVIELPLSQNELKRDKMSAS